MQLTWNELARRTMSTVASIRCTSPAVLVESKRALLWSSLCAISGLQVMPTLTSKLGFSFTPGGLLFPYHLGVAKCLQREGFLAHDTPIAGASAGALVAAIIGCGVDIDTATTLTGKIFHECREGGAAFRLMGIVRQGLEDALPCDAHDVLNGREGKVTIGVTNVFPRPTGVFIDEFASREDLVEVLLGSCHVPFWFSSRPYMHVRGQAAFDGFFAMPYKYIGAPPVPGAEEVVRVTAFPTTSVKIYSQGPGDVISPDLLDRYASGRFLELLHYSFNPANEDVRMELFDAGMESGESALVGGGGFDYVLRSWRKPWTILRPFDAGSRFRAVTYTAFYRDPLKLFGPEYEEDAVSVGAQ